MKDSLDPISLYFKQLKSMPEMKHEEFIVEFKKYIRGDKNARQKLIEGNLRLVIPIAKRYYRQGVDFLDLIEEGNIGLMHALKKFDHKKGFRFSTYSAYWIEQAIRRHIDEQSKTIRIPPHALESLRKWLKEWDRFHGQMGRDPTMGEMSKKLNLSARQIKGVLDASEAARGIGSLESPIDDDENLTMKDVICDASKNMPDEVLSLLRLHDELEEVMSKLPPRERQIVEMRYGLRNPERLTLEKIGKRYRLSRERVRQLEQRAVLRLKRSAQRMGLI